MEPVEMEGPGKTSAWSGMNPIMAGLLAKIELGGKTAILNLQDQGGKATVKPMKCRAIVADGRTDSHPPLLRTEEIAALEGTMNSLVEGGRTDPPLGPSCWRQKMRRCLVQVLKELDTPKTAMTTSGRNLRASKWRGMVVKRNQKKRSIKREGVPPTSSKGKKARAHGKER